MSRKIFVPLSLPKKSCKNAYETFVTYNRILGRCMKIKIILSTIQNQVECLCWRIGNLSIIITLALSNFNSPKRSGICLIEHAQRKIFSYYTFIFRKKTSTVTCTISTFCIGFVLFRAYGFAGYHVLYGFYS